jgi:hypothetical protein
MRKFHKQQLNELLNTLKEANNELFKPESIPTLASLKADITEYIEAFVEFVNDVTSDSDTNKNKAITTLRAYAKSLENIADTDAKRLSKHIRNIEVAIFNLKIDMLEIVFIVDSVAKSDVLLPLYKVASADPNCIARWLPVPLYGLDNCGFWDEPHYDGADYYKDIKCEDWHSFDLERVHPDVIFTNNIYDDKNYVTQLHPKFWSGRLRSCTDYLVYAHYGIDNWVANDPDSIDWNTLYQNNELACTDRHFNIKYYLVQSQELAKAITSMWNFYFKKTKTRKPLGFNEKFLPLGSPKFDTIHELPYTDYPIPTDWQEKIFDTNGNKKTVVLYASTLKDLLTDIEVWFKKFETVMDFFKDRGDVVCICRLHPLTLQTIKAMRNQYLDQYLKFVSDIKENRNLILDETADFHTAIKISDCYFGEESSILSLYFATGKPLGLIWTDGGDWGPPVDGKDTTFHKILDWQVEAMKSAPGGNIYHKNNCIWWGVFIDNNQPHEFLKLFLHYVQHQNEYPQTEEYIQLKQEILKKYYANSDGTASEKIYDFIKSKVLT